MNEVKRLNPPLLRLDGETGDITPAASPDERLREAAVIEAVAWSLFPDHPRPMSEAGLDCARRAIDTALFAAADREAPDEEEVR